jgi:hypothetical protein
MRKLENIAIVLALLSSIALSLYHISEEGFLGLTAIGWAIVWSVAVNLLSISFVTYIIAKERGLLRWFWGVTFLPYFVVKMLYDLSAYSSLHEVATRYENYLSLLMIDFVLIGMVFYLIKFYREKN